MKKSTIFARIMGVISLFVLAIISSSEKKTNFFLCSLRRLHRSLMSSKLEYFGRLDECILGEGEIYF